MTLEQLLNRFDGIDRSIVVVNRTDPDPVLNMLVDTFGGDAVDVVDGMVMDADGELEGVDSELRGVDSELEGVDGGREHADGGGEHADGGWDADRHRERIDAAERPRSSAALEAFTTGSATVDGNGTASLSIDPDALRRNDAVSFEGSDSESIENLALLLEDGAVVAGSTLAELGEAVLFVNSDLYTTGSRALDDMDLPAVITGLEDALFTLRGYPESNRQKLLLLTSSRA